MAELTREAKWVAGKGKLRAALKAAREAAGWPGKKSRHVEAIVAAAGEAMVAGEAYIDALSNEADEGRIELHEALQRAEVTEGALVGLLMALADFRRGLATDGELDEVIHSAVNELGEEAWKHMSEEWLVAPNLPALPLG